VRTPARRPFQDRFSAVLALAAIFDMSLGPRGEVVIEVLDDRSEEMEFALVSCQADEPDAAACHVVP
jgi:hypothetical protein